MPGLVNTNLEPEPVHTNWGPQLAARAGGKSKGLGPNKVPGQGAEKYEDPKPIKVAHLQKLPNHSMLNGVLVIEVVKHYFSKRKKNFGRLIKQETFQF